MPAQNRANGKQLRCCNDNHKSGSHGDRIIGADVVGAVKAKAFTLGSAAHGFQRQPWGRRHAIEDRCLGPERQQANKQQQDAQVKQRSTRSMVSRRPIRQTGMHQLFRILNSIIYTL